MRKESLPVLLLILLLKVFIAGSCKKSEMTENEDPVKLWNMITNENSYTNWSFWPDHRGMQPGHAPHGPFNKVYVNEPAMKAAKTPMPDGSVVVKENYSKNKKLAAITVMKKIKGYNPDGGDWFWVKYSPDGKADKSGRVEGCIKCHEAHSANDYVFVHMIK